MTAILAEALAVAVFGGILAFAANGVSPSGLALGRDYFPKTANAGLVREATAAPVATAPTNKASAPVNPEPAVKVNSKGLQLLDGSQAEAMFRDLRRQLDIVVFVDARDDEHYAEGHVPGAFHFDPYRPEKYLAEIIPVCQMAEQIVVYCTGGDCEDSQFAAIGLRNAGIPNERLFVFTGGITEWTTNHLPVETGVRNSGTLRPASP